MTTLLDSVTTRLGFMAPPRGYTDLVSRDASVSMVGVKPVTVHGPGWRELHEVNERVNRSATYAREPRGQDTWGRFWMVGGIRRGDCDDFAVRKLKQLVHLEWPRGSLLLTVCLVAGVGHCVLCVTTDKGRLVLDNRHAGVVDTDHRLYSGYAWIGEEWPGHTFWWRSLR